MSGEVETGVSLQWWGGVAFPARLHRNAPESRGPSEEARGKAPAYVSLGLPICAVGIVLAVPQ